MLASRGRPWSVGHGACRPNTMIDAEDLLRRFVSYAKLDTQADPASKSTPSSEKQWPLLRQLEGELKELGLADVRLSDHGYVLATVPATSLKPGVPVVSFWAHVDTAPGPAADAKPLVHRNYDGGRIILPDDPAKVLDPAAIPALRGRKGQTIITASGTTLLGADDKAGIAAIMAAVKHLLAHPEIPHGKLRICFNPDEEIGRGTEQLDLEELGADVAYTVDAELPGQVDYETFSADSATVTIRGVASHPGWAKGVMVNALRIAGAFLAGLPHELAPEATTGREGFIHPVSVQGGAEAATVNLILRDFEVAGLEAQGRLLRELAARLQAEHPRAAVEVKVEKQYRNMRYGLELEMRPVELALEAMRRAGLEPFSTAIRGGTDGARLTERGLPAPNLFAGFNNIHSELEWVSLGDMVKSAEVIVKLAQLWEERA
ncbi:MAG: peptidase T [Limisphaerales bacterium]